ncbi:hypothetical protein EV363DRAFT_1268615 [Boletus edulis]|nr:hypothetical protein EV363DRAFT_1268615 [Boletus edulis]
MRYFDADGDSDSPFPGIDSDDPRPWTLAVKTPATVAHVVAILVTILRLFYRCRLSRFSWEDTWATLALICDIGCLTSVWMQVSPGNSYPMPLIDHQSNWLLSLTITSIVWFARMSILSSVVRIANPAPKLRFVAYCIGAMFLTMEAGLLAQKIYICIKLSCRFTTNVAIAQLVTDIISDTILVVVPIRFLRDIQLARDRRILILSAFSACMLITGVTILHSALLFQEVSNLTFIIGHVKAALALFVCNALILVTFAYRVYHKAAFDFEYNDGGGSRVAEFTSIIHLPSKSNSAVLPTTSGLQSNGDAAHTRTPTSTWNTSAGLELDTLHTRMCYRACRR